MKLIAMNVLPEIVTHPELVAEIVKQFAFMKVMAQPEDTKFNELNEVSLDEIFRQADVFFVDYTTYEEAIDTAEVSLEEAIRSFLEQWKYIVDIEAIQQNVHYNLQP